MFNSLSKKIVAFMIVLTLICTTSLTVVSYLMVKSSMEVQMKNDGKTLISVLSKQLERYGSYQLQDINELFRNITDKNIGILEYISIADKNLNIIVDDLKVTGIKDEVDGVTSATEQGDINKTLENGTVSGFIFKTKNGTEVYNVSSTLTLMDGFTGVINVGISLTPMYHQLNDTLRNTIIISVIVQIITIIAATLVGKSLTNPLRKIVKSLKRVEENDLTVEIDIRTKDEIQKVSNAINNTIENLRTTIGTIKVTTERLNDSSTILAKSSMDSTSFSEEIAASVEEVNAVIENQNSNIMSISENFDAFSKKLEIIIIEISNILTGNKNIDEKTNESYTQLQVLIASINEVREYFAETRQKISELNINITKIDEITEVINTVAEQTNLLSLNASIEAARVGAMGTGFGVVADEIRNLSEQVRESSNSINNIVRTITNSSNEILEDSLIISEKMENQISTIHVTVDSCDAIKDEVRKNTSHVKQVSSTLEVIKDDSDNINNSINEVSNISGEISASTQEVAATLMNQTESTQKNSQLGETLSKIAEELNEMVNEFKI